ncbi:MAG: TonB-dependent receptor [Opitutaceae bacterium]
MIQTKRPYLRHAPRFTSLARAWCSLAFLTLALEVLGQGQQIAPVATGTIEGRVLNGATGAALSNARIVVDGTALETASDDYGRFRLREVMSGPATITVSYVGYDRTSVTVDVPSGGVVQREVDLTLSGTAPGEKVVVMQALAIVATREQTAQALSMNEQRASANIKSVVALDEYGDLGQENVGDFLRFLPGLTVGSAGLTANEISVRGLPGNTTQVMIDGNMVTSAETDRVVPPHLVSLGNVSRVEVTKVPTPDMSAAGLGGTVNLKRRKAFGRKSPVGSFELYELINTNSGITLSGGPRGPLPGVSPKYNEPSWSVNYLLPVGDDLGFSASLGQTFRKGPRTGRDETPTWNIVNGFQRASAYQHITSIVKTDTGQAGVDWRLNDKHTLSANFSHKGRWVMVPRDSLSVNFGTGATGDSSFTQGAATGVGTATMGSGGNAKTENVNRMVSLGYTFESGGWELSIRGTVSDVSLTTSDMSNGHFNTISATIPNLIIRGEGIGVDGSKIPTRFLATTRTGQQVNIYDGANYTLASAASSQSTSKTDASEARIDLTRSFKHVTLKVGTVFNKQERDRVAEAVTYSFNPNGSTAAADRLAGKYDIFDTAYNATNETVNGVRANWINVGKLYDLYRQHPDWFVENAATSHTNRANNSRKMNEEITATYLRADFKLMSNRLWLVLGARHENTMTEGYGVLNDPNARYMRDAAGKIVRNNGQPVFISTDPLVQAQQQYKERGAYKKRSYDGIYPSLNGTYTFTDSLLLRAGYAKTIGRPNLSFVIPGVTVPNADATAPRTFSVVNTGLLPWTADNYDLSLESYQIKGGFGTIGVFQKDIENFFNVVTTPATPELADLYGIPQAELQAGDQISTRTNGGNARIQGIEFMYRQRLLFLPTNWAKSLQVFVNVTKLSLSGDRESDFGSFTPLNYAWGVSLKRPRFSINFTASYQGEIRRDLVAASVANGIPADTYDYDSARRRLTLGAEYSLYKGVSIYGSLANIGELNVSGLRYAPTTPEFARITRYQELGSTLTVGLKGTF